MQLSPFWLCRAFHGKRNWGISPSSYRETSWLTNLDWTQFISLQHFASAFRLTSETFQITVSITISEMHKLLQKFSLKNVHLTNMKRQRAILKGISLQRMVWYRDILSTVNLMKNEFDLHQKNIRKTFRNLANIFVATNCNHGQQRGPFYFTQITFGKNRFEWAKWSKWLTKGHSKSISSTLWSLENSEPKFRLGIY